MLERMIPAEEQPKKAVAAERGIDLTLTSLKKGSHLLKYGRRGRPKFCPFRLSNDESTLIWFSGKEEKQLKLSLVSRIIPGQRTEIFQRYPRPEKEYQSFSLIYDEGSLDLICKDKEEAELWFTGLKALISRGINGKWRVEPRSGFSSEATSPRARTRASSPLRSTLHNGTCSQKDGIDGIHFQTSEGSPPKMTLEKALSDVLLHSMPPKGLFPSDSARGSMHSISSGGSDGTMGCRRGMNLDAFRVSLSSAVSTSSQGSGHDDGDPLGDIFIWGEGTCDGLLGGGMHRVGTHHGIELDSLVPKPLDSAVRLDVQSVACGGRHAALVTKQGDVFTWGEELGGRLGHGVDSDVSHPKVIESLKNINFEHVACGEYHSCAVSLSGGIYVWGNSSCNAGQGSHGSEASWWIPKKLIGYLDGVHVSSVSCGPWHTALVTSVGQLFTFGEGTFGVLGHGDRRSVSMPREVESLKGLRTFGASCGVWHTAAVVEVMVGSSNSGNCSSVKLFTWGDGDKGQLGHGDRESRLVPTCVAPLVEQSFCQVACGHSLTVALTMTGHVYTMGSSVCGQLGNPRADGNVPTRVEGTLSTNFVEEISCGSHHVAVLTSNSQVYTWGKGANGRLGHGDVEDRNSPTLVEALQDKRVKSIVCGTSFSAAICLHKWLSGLDQSLCSACRLPFNFKRKRHNCYNCGLAFCNSCSSKKSMKAAMAPVSNKPHRVCDNCYDKLKKATETNSVSLSAVNRRESINPGSNVANKNDSFDSKFQFQFSKYPFVEIFKEGESRPLRRNKKLGFRSRASSPPGGATSRHNENPKSSNSVFGSSKKFFSVSLPGSRMASRASSPTSKRPSPPRSATPLPALSCLTSSKVFVDDTAGTNDSISDEIFKLRAQVDELTHKTELQEIEIGKTTKKLKEALAVAAEETTKCKAAKEVIKALTAQLKELAGILQPRNTISLPTTNASDQTNHPEPCHELTKTESHCSKDTDTTHSECNPKSRIRQIVEPNDGDEWVEQDEPGVYITLVALPGGSRDLKRIRFSRKRFSEKQAEQWWAANRGRVYQRYNVPEAKEDSTQLN